MKIKTIEGRNRKIEKKFAENNKEKSNLQQMINRRRD